MMLCWTIFFCRSVQVQDEDQCARVYLVYGLIDILRERAADVETLVARKELVEEVQARIGYASDLKYLLSYADGKIARDGGGGEWRLMRKKNGKGGGIGYWLKPVEREEGK